jgi:phage-related tail fiber protein
MDRSYAIVTVLGQGMIAEAIRLGTDINLEMAAVGDADYHPLEGQTALMNERARLPIVDITRDDKNPAWLRIMTVIPPSVGGWDMWEAGVYAENGNLFAIARLDGAYKPIYADDNYAKEVALDIILEVSSAANVNLAADPHVIIATREWVHGYVYPKVEGLQALINDHSKRRDNPHQVTAAQAGAYTKAETDSRDTAVNNSLNTHTANKSNPHGVTAAQAGTYTKAEIDALIAELKSRTPVGVIEPYWGTAAPYGSFACDGSTYDTANYPKLYAVLGGNKLPDLRGLFVRGYDTRNTIDPEGASRAIGSVQQDAMQPISGTVTGGAFGNGPGTATGCFSSVSSGGGSETKDSRSAMLVTFDSSSQTRTANETRGKNAALLWCIRHD